MLPSVIQALSSMRAELLQLLVQHLHVEKLFLRELEHCHNDPEWSHLPKPCSHLSYSRSWMGLQDKRRAANNETEAGYHKNNNFFISDFQVLDHLLEHFAEEKKRTKFHTLKESPKQHSTTPGMQIMLLLQNWMGITIISKRRQPNWSTLNSLASQRLQGSQGISIRAWTWYASCS